MVTRLEVQYAVRVPGPDGWHVLPKRYTRRMGAERAAEMRSTLGAEVVAQVVMVAGDWTDPDTAEATARDWQDREQVPAGIVSFEGEVSAEEMAEFAERWRAASGPQSFVLRRRTPEGRRAYLDAKRAELEAAGKDTEIIDLIEQTGDDHG